MSTTKLYSVYCTVSVSLYKFVINIYVLVLMHFLIICGPHLLASATCVSNANTMHKKTTTFVVHPFNHTILN